MARTKTNNMFRCPNPECGGALVVEVHRRKTLENGETRYAGTFFGCPNWKDNGCDYAVSLDTGTPSGKVYRRYVLGENVDVPER